MIIEINHTTKEEFEEDINCSKSGFKASLFFSRKP